jgi:sugar (pentulose or hexulose) kinase
MRLSQDPALDIAQTFLTIPDLFNFWLTGSKANEYTDATTTQCHNPTLNSWAWDLLETFQIPTHIFQDITPSGTILGAIRSPVARQAACPPIPVVAVGSHDTASAVAAVPAERPDFIYISSGTWSLIGIEIDRPIITNQSLAYNLTNEGGLNGKIRFLKNIMGMWLVEECRREWSRAGYQYSYAELVALAGQATAFRSLISPSHAHFLAPGDMIARIHQFCRETSQPIPSSPGEIVRCLLESLALEYRSAAAELDEVSGLALPVIHIIGGGSRNHLLNQFTADAAGRVVYAGPVEATAIGSLLAQALALGLINSLAEGRALVRMSFEINAYFPGEREPWDQAYERYEMIKSNIKLPS